MRKTGRLLLPVLVAFALLLDIAPVLAVDDIVISINSDKKLVYVGDEFTITYSISVTNPKKFSLKKSADFNKIKGAELISTREKTTSYLIGGIPYTTFIYRYTIRASKAGAIKAGRSVFTYESATYKTSPVAVRVLPAAVSIKKRDKVVRSNAKEAKNTGKVEKKPAEVAKEPAKKRDIEKNMGRRPKKQGRMKEIMGLAGSFAVESVASNPSPYVGEGVVYQFRFYHKIEYVGAPAFSPPQFTGFYVEELPQSRGLVEVERFGGEFIIEEVNYILFPLVAGNVTIPPASLEVRDSAGKMNTLWSDPTDIVVRKLPEYKGNVAIPFSGSVGELSIALELDTNKMIVEAEPFQVSLTVKGVGNITGISEPRFISTDDFDYTLIEAKSSVDKEIDRISGEKRFVYSVTARRAGDIPFDGAAYVYFDTQKVEYVEARTKAAVLNVKPGKNEAAKERAAASAISAILAPIRAGVIISKRTPFYKTHYYTFIMLFLVFSSLLVVSVSLKRGYEERNKDALVKKRAVKTALTGIRDARAHLHNQKIEDFYIQMRYLLNQFFKEKFGIELIAHSLDSLAELINVGKKDKKVIKELISNIKLLNYFRYSTVEVTEDELKDYLTELRRTLKELK